MAEAKTLPWQMDTAAQRRADPDTRLKDYWKNLEYELEPLSEHYSFKFKGHFNEPPPLYERALHVSPIPTSIDIATLMAIFSPYGHVLDTRVFVDENYAAVIFAVKHAARKAQQALNGQLLFMGAGITQVGFASIHRKQGEFTFGVIRPAWTDHVPHNPLLRYLTGRAVQSDGNIQDEDGAIVGRIHEGSLAGHYNCTVQDTDYLYVSLEMTSHRGDVVNALGKRVARASLMPWKEKQLRQQGYGVWKSFQPRYDKLVGRPLNSDGDVFDSDGELLAYCSAGYPTSDWEGTTVATDGEVLDTEGNLVQKVTLYPSMKTNPSGEEEDVEGLSFQTIEKEYEAKENGTSEDTTREEDMTEEGDKKKEDEAPKPAFYTHYTISRDLSGSNDEVATKLLSALGERERSRENRFAKADLTLLASRR